MSDLNLTEWNDRDLGHLTWDATSGSWTGRTTLGGREVGLEIDVDRKQPTRDDQVNAIPAAKGLLAILQSAEPTLRQAAAEQLSQELDGRPAADPLATSMSLDSVCLHSSGSLYYRSDLLRGALITVYFEKDLSFGDVETQEL